MEIQFFRKIVNCLKCQGCNFLLKQVAISEQLYQFSPLVVPLCVEKHHSESACPPCHEFIVWMINEFSVTFAKRKRKFRLVRLRYRAGFASLRLAWVGVWRSFRKIMLAWLSLNFSSYLVSPFLLFKIWSLTHSHKKACNMGDQGTCCTGWSAFLHDKAAVHCVINCKCINRTERDHVVRPQKPVSVTLKDPKT